MDRDIGNIIPMARRRKTPKGHDVRSLGPSDSSDERVRPGHDIGTDRVVGAEEAGLGDGLDEAEKAERDHPRH